MSIIRWGEHGSAVYIIGYDDKWECVGCDGPDAISTYQKFLEHLSWHRKKGDCVPEIVEDRLMKYEAEL